MSEGTARPDLKPFPVRVGAIEPVRIDFEAFAQPAAAKLPEYHDPASVDFRVQIKYRVDESSGIVVGLADSVFGQVTKGASDGSGEKVEATAPKPPYRLNVAVAAAFVYDPKEMSRAEVTTWCEKGSFYVLFPYLRHLVFDTTAKTGFPTVTLPLVLLPILRDGSSIRKDEAPASPV